MAKYTDLFASLTDKASSGAGTAVNVSQVESWTGNVSYTSSGGTMVIVIEGTTAATSTGTYTDISNVTTTGATSGSYDVSKALTPYHYVRARVHTFSSSGVGTYVTANIYTQADR